MFLSWIVSRFHIFILNIIRFATVVCKVLNFATFLNDLLAIFMSWGCPTQSSFSSAQSVFVAWFNDPQFGTSKITHARYLVSAFNPNIFGCQCKHCDLPTLFAESSWSGLGFFRHPYWRNCPNPGSVTKCLRTRWSKQVLAVATVRSFFQNASKRNYFAFLTSNSTESLH